MQTVLPLTNPIMTYPWGSYDAIADLLGQAVPSKEPQAELWMGGHPKAPSVVRLAGKSQRLDELIRNSPQEILGQSVAAAYRNQLPFLFKVLSARQPLSIQAHPGSEHAQAGYERENRLQIPLDAAERNYKDPNPKPECICALDEFWALCGFRPPDEIARLLEKVSPHAFADEVKSLRDQDEAGALEGFFTRLLALAKAQRADLAAQALAGLKNLSGTAEQEAIQDWIRRIADAFPDDIGILAPAFLNLIRLEPGQALFLPAGSLHAYLKGTGIELMASSDNVLRGALTPKHVDSEELVKVLHFAAWRPEVIVPVQLAEGEHHYPCPAKEFRLSVLAVSAQNGFQGKAQRSVEIMLCTRGEVQVIPDHDPAAGVALRKGSSILIPAAAPAYRILGDGVLYRADVPDSDV